MDKVLKNFMKKTFGEGYPFGLTWFDETWTDAHVDELIKEAYQLGKEQNQSLAKED